MRISDWSSDVCSSDLGVCRERGRPGRPDRQGLRHADVGVPGDLCIAADDLGRVAAVAAAGGHRRGIALKNEDPVISSAARNLLASAKSRFLAALEMTGEGDELSKGQE